MKKRKEVIAAGPVFELAIEHIPESIDYQHHSRIAEGYWLTMSHETKRATMLVSTGRFSQKALETYARAFGTGPEAESLWTQIGTSKPLSEMLRNQ